MGEEDSPSDARGLNLERHIQTILIAIITGAILFAANYFYNDNRDKALSQSQLEVLIVQVAEMRNDLKALQTNYVRPSEMVDVQSRLLELERKVK